MGEKKGSKLKKFFLFAFFASLFAGVMSFLKRRRMGGDENEWQELPPPER